MIIHNYHSGRAFRAAGKVEHFDCGRLSAFLSQSSEYETIYRELRAGTDRSALVAKFSEQTVKYTEICIENITHNN